MQSTWLELVDCLLRPARPRLAHCLRESERHLAEQQRWSDLRAQAVAHCEQRIRDARSAVFAASDGVVGAQMTSLERAWRRLMRRDPERGLMDLWARMAPAAWLDHKRWRDSAPAAWLEAAVALAADAESVEQVERELALLRERLAPYGVPLTARVRWRLLEQDSELVVALLSGPLCAASDACPAAERAVLLERAARCGQAVLAAVQTRFGDRPGLARELAHAALVDYLWRAASLPAAANPVTPLRAIWARGYLLAELSSTCVTLATPSLPQNESSAVADRGA